MRRPLILAALLALASSAQAQTWRTFEDQRGSTTFTPEGVYQTFPDSRGGGSITYGPGGYTAQTFGDALGGSTTFVSPGSRQRGW